MTAMQARPFVKWVGGKRKLIPEIMKHVPAEYDTYHEPFIGGGALFFHLRPARAVISDANLRLVRTYRGVRDSVDEVVELLRSYPNEKDFFLAKRAESIDANPADAHVAAWFIYLNKTCFNGLYRVNRGNGFNSPFGKYANPAICDEENLRACSEALRHATIQHGPYSDVAARANDGDFCYFDPPYVPVSDTADFTSYTADGFTDSDQRALRDLARSLMMRGVRVLLSNSDTPPVRKMYGGFAIDTIMAARAINCDGEKRGKVAEVLIH